ncbi:MAG: 16S rRNA (adenine(1518)-N(6)/adenine(1519)-N(6))-dimethyltransferase RsmA [Candidatus Sericytochromatia bacterium]
MRHASKPKKHWGQHFLLEPERLEICLDLMEIAPGDAVLEIGPGEGVLTRTILERGAQVHAVEVDPELVAFLQSELGHEDRFKLQHADIMGYDLRQFAPDVPFEQRKLMANIPYYLSSALIHKLLNAPALREGFQPGQVYFSRICLMVQREVALKLVATPGSPSWGLLSILTQLAAQVVWIDDVPRSAFYPAPQVDSALVMLEPRLELPIAYPDPAGFWKVAERIFQLRRKNLRNVLRSWQVSESTLALMGEHYDLRRRGETLSLQELADFQQWLVRAMAAEESV